MSLSDKVRKMHLTLGQTEPFALIESESSYERFWIMQYPLTGAFLRGHLLAGHNLPSTYNGSTSSNSPQRVALRENPLTPIVVNPADKDDLANFLKPYIEDGFRLPTSEEYLLAFGNEAPDSEPREINGGQYFLSPSGVLYFTRGSKELVYKNDFHDTRKRIKFQVMEPRSRMLSGTRTYVSKVEQKPLKDYGNDSLMHMRLVLPPNVRIPQRRIPGSPNYAFAVGGR